MVSPHYHSPQDRDYQNWTVAAEPDLRSIGLHDHCA
jgi:hypothetical protein